MNGINTSEKSFLNHRFQMNLQLKQFFLFFVITILGTIFSYGQEKTTEQKLTELNQKVDGLVTKLSANEANLSKLSKLKVSGYIQAQYQNFESPALLSTSQNYFSLRRARVKFTYTATDGIKFVLQPNITPGDISLKDAYVVLNDRWTNSFSLTAGKFNRINYEVEYSSSNREMPERSRVIRTLYPGERAIGAKLEFETKQLPLRLQFAVLNGNEDITISNAAGTNLNSTESKDYDNYKDIMARATYKLDFKDIGTLNFGAHGYFGAIKSNAIKTLKSDYTTLSDIAFGDPLRKEWIGGEFQFEAKSFGGFSIKGEYLSGNNATVGYSPVVASGTTSAAAGSANYQNNFEGYYLYLIKNIGKKNQFAFRYDYYDPNTDLKGKNVGITGFTSPDLTTLKSKSSGKSDLATSTFGFAFHHFFDDNIKITLSYDIVNNEKAGTSNTVVESYTTAHGLTKSLDWSNAINQNLFTLRIQAKF